MRKTLNIDDPHSWVILLVDDEIDNLEVIAQSLAFFGATVKTAENGQKGLQILEDYPANLILMDLSMPVMDGWTARAKIRENLDMKNVPVLALTAHAMAGDKDRAMAAGFDGYLTKPVNIPTLVSDLKHALLDAKNRPGTVPVKRTTTQQKVVTVGTEKKEPSPPQKVVTVDTEKKEPSPPQKSQDDGKPAQAGTGELK